MQPQRLRLGADLDAEMLFGRPDAPVRESSSPAPGPPAVGDRRLADIQPKDVQELLDTLKRQGASASTIDTTLTPLKAIRECDRGQRLVVGKVGIEQELAQTVRPFLRRVSS